MKKPRTIVRYKPRAKLKGPWGTELSVPADKWTTVALAFILALVLICGAYIILVEAKTENVTAAGAFFDSKPNATMVAPRTYNPCKED